MDQNTEKSKYYEQNSEATLSTKSTDKVESTEMRKLSSDKNKVGHEEATCLKPSEHDGLELILSLRETDSDSSMQTEKIKKDSSDAIKVVI